MNQDELDRLSVTTLRMLAVDMVEQANSGHPGLPLGAAPMAYVLWSRFLRHNPTNPRWPGRDRFILSAGHGSALLYALLHLTGYDLPISELQRFRQWGSRTPGHPEYGHTPGVEATTGPLGQGFAMGVGMALAQRKVSEGLAAEGRSLLDHHLFALVSDGDLMEGISYEAASLAGHWGLGRLVYLYDDNHISIEGDTALSFSEEVEHRFTACGWQVLTVADGEDLAAIEAAIRQGMAEEQRPSLIRVRTHIGYGSPKADDAAAHGSPLGAGGMAATRAFYQWPDESFRVPPEVRDHLGASRERGQKLEQAWEEGFSAYAALFPEQATALRHRLANQLPKEWNQALLQLDFGTKPIATRSASGQALNALASDLPALLGGSADLAPSNNTWIKGGGERNIHFGVREHGMAAIANGMALYGGVIPYCGTFLVFSDYMRPAIRLAALMGTHTIFVLTHDSIAVGEDGPTHQPVEHVAALRAIPDLLVIRPADAQETVAAWNLAVGLRRPTALILTRQNVPILQSDEDGVAKGAYLLADCRGEPELLLLASGSEVHLALAAQEALEHHEIQSWVISMPCWELFEEQPESYRQRILPPRVRARVAIEAGSSMGWHRWVGDRGDVVSVDRFGASAPGPQVMRFLGLTVENIVAKALSVLKRH